MDIREQVEIMKAEARLANRSASEGIRNWTPEARAKSLATRRARGSVWGWDKRKRASFENPYTSDAAKRSMDAMFEDASDINETIDIHRSGGYTFEAPNQASENMKQRYLEAFKEWLSGVRRVDDAIGDFNETVAVMGGLTSGAAMAQRGKVIGPSYASPVAESPARKTDVIEKSIRRNFEKRNSDYLRKYPSERDVMMDMVAEKAEYYSAQPAQKVEIEKAAYRRIKDYGSMTMGEAPAAQGADYKTLLEAKRNYVREREAVRPQLQADEVAYPAGNGVWIGRLPSGDERVISAFPDDGGIGNRWTAASRAASLAVRRAKGSVWGWDKRKRASGDGSNGSAPKGNGKTWKDYLNGGFEGLDPDYAAKAIRRIEESEAYGKKLSADEARFQKEYNDYVEEMNKGSGNPKEAAKEADGGDQPDYGHHYGTPDDPTIQDDQSANGGGQGDEVSSQANESYKKNGAKGMTEEERLALIDEVEHEMSEGKSQDPDTEHEILSDLKNASAQWNKMVDGFRKVIEGGAKVSTKNLDAQFKKDKDEAKYKMAIDALSEAWHTMSLDKFQDKFEGNPKNNKEFRAFQREIKVPDEFIGD